MCLSAVQFAVNEFGNGLLDNVSMIHVIIKTSITITAIYVCIYV